MIHCLFCRDLSEQIKKVTKESHVRAENTELMLSFQRGQVTLQQYKVMQCSPTYFFYFYQIISLFAYLFVGCCGPCVWHHLLVLFSFSCARCMRSTRPWRKSWRGTATTRASHPFTSRLSWPGWRPSRKTWSSSTARTGERRLSSPQPLKDTPTDSDRYVSLNRTCITHSFSAVWNRNNTLHSCCFQIGKENPEFLVAHAYTRYLGDLSGGQVLGRIAQKSMGLKDREGLAFFAFPGVSSPNLFKQLYRSRMNSVELTEEKRNGVLEEAVRAFEFNIQVQWNVPLRAAKCSRSTFALAVAYEARGIWWTSFALFYRSLMIYRRCWVSQKTSCRIVQHTPNQ